MDKKNNSGMLVGILIGLVIALLVVGGLFATGTIGFKTTTTDNEQASENNKTESNESNDLLNQADFKKIVDDELYILFGFKSLNEVTNRRKLTLVFNKLDNNYNTIDTATKEKVEETFNSTSLKNLGIQHEDFDVFTFNNNVYTKNKELMSKRNLFYTTYANRVDNFEKINNRYVLSIKYLFPDDLMEAQYFYGSYSQNDQKDTNKIVSATVVQEYNKNDIRLASEKYFEDNYDSIKDKLDTYVYTFEVDGNNKINLVDFSIK